MLKNIPIQSNKGLLTRNSKKDKRTPKLLFFVAKGGKFKLIEEIVQEMKESNNEFTIISLDIEVRDRLIEKGIQSKCISFYCNQKFWEDIDKKSVEWIKDWPNQKVLNGKSIKEEFIYNNCSLWWFGRDALFSTNGGLFGLICYIEVFYSILRIENPTKVYWAGRKNFGFELIKEITNQLGLNFQDKGTKKLEIISSIWGGTKSLERYLIRIIETLYRKIALLIYNLKKKAINKSGQPLKKVLLIPHHGNYARPYWINDKRYIGDFYCRGIEEALRADKKLELLVLSPEAARFSKFSYFFDFWEIIQGNSYKPVEGYIKFSSYLKRLWYKFYFRKKWQKIAVIPSFKESLIYRKIDLYPFLKEHLKKLFVNSFSSAIGLLDTASNVLNKEKPDIILTIYDTSTDRRAMEVVARKHNIPIIGLQHGLMSSSPAGHIGYCHQQGETWYSGKSNVLQCPIATKTLVFGEYYKNLLVKYGYPKDRIIATGCPRFDYFYNYDRKIAINKCKNLGINTERKIILFISGGLCSDFMLQEIQRDDEKNIQMVKELLKTSQENVELVIKVHPRDNEKNYFCLFKEFPERKIKIIKYGDLAALIQCASVVVISSSTVGIEAVISKKPIIDLDLFSEPQFVPYYVDEGVAIAAYDRDSLQKALNQLLNQTKTREKLISNMDKFVKKFAYKMDGKSSSRVKEVVLKELQLKSK